MRRYDTWVCVADGRSARFFCCDPQRHLEPVMDFGIPDNPGPLAGRLAGQLDRAVRGDRFEHLVLVGPRSFLREVEGHVAPPTRERILADVIDPTLIRSTPREVACHLSGLLPQGAG
ncbi:MAG: host attachment protein [Solirubrobacterales bacterium]